MFYEESISVYREGEWQLRCAGGYFYIVTTCRATNNAPWSMNSGDQHIHFKAMVDGQADGPELDVLVARRQIHVSIESGPTSVAVPGSATVTARITDSDVFIPDTPYYITIKNDDTGEVVAQCNAYTFYNSNTCNYGFYVGWYENANGARHFSAYAATADGSDQPSTPAHITIGVDRHVFDVGITPSESSVKVGGSASVTARVAGNAVALSETPYYLKIRDDDTNQVVAQCRPFNYYNINTCTYGFSVDWGENADPHARHFSAYVATEAEDDIASAPASTSIGVEPYAVNLAPEDESLSIPSTGVLHASTVDDLPTGSPLRLQIRDETHEQIVASCPAAQNACDYEFPVTWTDNSDSGEREFSAYLANGSSEDSEVADAEINIEPRDFDVRIELGEKVNPSDPTPVTASASSTPSVVGTPYSLKIRKEEPDQVVASCTNSDGPGTTCGADLGAGTYFATVEDDTGEIFGRSTSWTVDDGGNEIDNDVSGIDLSVLAKGFGSAAAVCEAVMFSPYRTYLMAPSSTLSDQYRTCDTIANAGGSARLALQKLAALSAGAAVVEWLAYYGRDLGPGTTVPDLPWHPSHPDTPGSAGTGSSAESVPAEYQAQLDLFWEQNETRFSTKEKAAVAFSACAAATVATGSGLQLCSTLPVFFSGRLTNPDSTEHDWDAQRYFNPIVPYFGLELTRFSGQLQ